MGTINAIMARDLRGGIGYKTGLPWTKNKEDMAWFRKHTRNHAIVMGRTTWESLGAKPLPNRTNLVITRTPIAGIQTWFGSNILPKVQKEYPNQDIWVIGGASIYTQSLDCCEKLYLTTFKSENKSDTFMPNSYIDSFGNIEYRNETEELIFEIRSK